MKPARNIKAEDILADNTDSRQKDIPIEQAELADAIKAVVKSSGNERMTEDEKADLRQSIEADKAHYRSLRLPFWVKIAASVIVVLGIVLWQFREKETGALRKFASDSMINNRSGETRLILGEGKVLSLKGQSSVIYNKEGLKIFNDSSATISEEMEKLSAFNTLLVPYGRRSQLTLEDGTKVWLNSGSRLIYPVSFDTGKREVYLEGEAYFSVAHNPEKPFYVQSKHMNIKVLGTEFNVTTYSDDKRNYAALVNGSIELSVPGNWFKDKVRKLVPGELAVYDPAEEQLKISKVNTEEYTSWKEGYILLEKAPLRTIIKRLARYYNIPVDIDPKIGNGETFSGRLDFQKNIADVMDIICAGTTYNYDSSERRLTLKQ